MHMKYIVVLSCALKDQQELYNCSRWYYTEQLFLTTTNSGNEFLLIIFNISNSVPDYFEMTKPLLALATQCQKCMQKCFWREPETMHV